MKAEDLNFQENLTQLEDGYEYFSSIDTFTE